MIRNLLSHAFGLRVLSGAVAATGVVVMLAPVALLQRFAQLEGELQDYVYPVYAFGLGLVAIAISIGWDVYRSRFAEAAVLLLSVAMFVLFTAHLAGWWIDDAGITFAYSRSLVEGYGLVFQPGAPAEEGYSSTLWMLLLAGAGLFGLDIPMAAKLSGIAFASIALLLVLDVIRRETGSLAAVVLGAAAVTTAPFVVWAASGQEHALQALILTLIAYILLRLPAWRVPVTAMLSLLVLARPEAPLIVMAVFAAAIWVSWRDGLGFDLRRNIPLALAPFIVFVGLIGFRVAYFGDPLPNPYYAKTSGASLAGLFNPFGGGWQYILSGLRDTGLLIVLPFVLLLNGWTLRGARRVVLALLAGHIFFVIWAKGDWMGQYRFLMPILPIMALIVVLAVNSIPGRLRRQALCVLATAFLLQSTVVQLNEFKARPTTPLSIVSVIGAEFGNLARWLDIEDASLAHHDAGAISYDRSIRLIDLGGLVDRTIAKNMSDSAFLERYLLEERQPDFVFGARRNFAAKSGFADGEAFARAYVRLEFPDKPIMKAELSYIRRDRVVQRPGIEILRDSTGKMELVIVNRKSAGG